MTEEFSQASATLNKDTFVAVGVVLTAAISLLNLGYSFANNRRSSYVGSVTATRLKWIGEVRDRLSAFIAVIGEMAAYPPSDSADRQRKFAELTQHWMLLRLQLAPKAAPLDKDFEAQIDSVYRDALSMTAAQIEPRIEDLVDCGQRFLWNEWLKVKKEAIYGDPYDTFPRRVKEWLRRLNQPLDASEPD